MKRQNEIPVPASVTWREIMTEFDLAEAGAIRAGFARSQAERRAEALAKNPMATPESVTVARLEAERAEQDQDRAESRVYRINEILLRYRPVDAPELLAKYAYLLKVYGGELEAENRFRDFASDIEAFAYVWPGDQIDQAAA
jgi:hypothetical protein